MLFLLEKNLLSLEQIIKFLRNEIAPKLKITTSQLKIPIFEETWAYIACIDETLLPLCPSRNLNLEYEIAKQFYTHATGLYQRVKPLMKKEIPSLYDASIRRYEQILQTHAKLPENGHGHTRLSDNNLGEIHLILGQVHMMNGNTPEALEHFKKVPVRSNSYGEALLEQCQSYLEHAERKFPPLATNAEEFLTGLAEKTVNASPWWPELNSSTGNTGNLVADTNELPSDLLIDPSIFNAPRLEIAARLLRGWQCSVFIMFCCTALFILFRVVLIAITRSDIDTISNEDMERDDILSDIMLFSLLATMACACAVCMVSMIANKIGEASFMFTALNRQNISHRLQNSYASICRVLGGGHAPSDDAMEIELKDIRIESAPDSKTLQISSAAVSAENSETETEDSDEEAVDERRPLLGSAQISS